MLAAPCLGVCFGCAQVLDAFRWLDAAGGEMPLFRHPHMEARPLLNLPKTAEPDGYKIAARFTFETCFILR